MDAIIDAWAWLTTADHWSGTGGVWQRLSEHLELTGLCLLLSAAIALPLAFWLGHGGGRRFGGTLAINISNAGRAVPTFAVLVLLTISPVGEHGEAPTIIALVLFGVPPLLTNAYVGVAEADRDVVGAARGMGMSPLQLMFRVELPLAYPLVMTGLRTAAVQLVATASLAALAGGGGLGRIITAGFDTNNTPQVFAGAVLVAGLALLVEGALALLQRLADPRRRPRDARRTPDDERPAASPGRATTTPEMETT
ncbi:osmoprotectant transport system permease protein [Streptomyces zhaozhouensis]|uniref:Osmoprotectant transport system permease protein n=1 Tax=Streptomyces zhaozhouensis TaxID=1300267 RepID=A0A286DWV1_9ACTN|nr:ABC transporter permease [Streptomyces zhaozhouensis]SOD63113.1 osmoprotectant transport system permease protein [Streptomyces zhaozhouensis]